MIHNSQLKLHFYNYDQLTRFRLSNAHHTIKLDPILDNRYDRFGLKSGAGSVGAGGQLDPFNSSLPDMMTVDEQGEPEFEAAGRLLAASATIAAKGQQQSKVLARQRQNDDVPSLGRPSQHNQHETEEQQQQPNFESANEVPPYNGLPTIKLDWLDDGNNEYRLRDIHFHWAERKDNGSEHAIDGRRAAMEVGLCHLCSFCVISSPDTNQLTAPI